MVGRIAGSPKLSRRLEPVNLRHLHVHEYKVERTRACGCLDHGDRFGSVAGDLRVHAGALRHGQDQRLIDVMILGD